MLAESARLVDLRELADVVEVAFDVPGMLPMPLSDLAQRFGELPRDRGLGLACLAGDRSLAASSFLLAQGYHRVSHRQGGLIPWAVEACRSRAGGTRRRAAPRTAAGHRRWPAAAGNGRPRPRRADDTPNPRSGPGGVVAAGAGLGAALTLRAGQPTVAEFGANACAACREMKPVLEALRREHGERIGVVEVDLIAQRQIGYILRYRTQLMPTQVFFDARGRETGRHLGTISAEQILARLEGGAR